MCGLQYPHLIYKSTQESIESDKRTVSEKKEMKS